MTTKPLLGELLIKNNLVSQEIVTQALRLQVGGNRRLGYILVRMKAITDDQLAEVLASQLDISITEIGKSFSPEVKNVIPRYLCKQYGVLPLSFKENNILELAMANPSDQEAINDLEHYTGRVIDPRLARHSDINKEIPRLIPLGLRDFFSPQVNTMTNRLIASIALICVVTLGVYTYDYIKKVREGTVSITSDLILYHNHDLTLALDKEGNYSLQGHGAFADGLYKVEFAEIENLESFIQQRERDLSGNQKDWLQWALRQAAKRKADGLVAKK